MSARREYGCQKDEGAVSSTTAPAPIINCIIGGGIFGVPGELSRLLGRASPLAMILAALGIAVILAVITEVASQFSDAGGPYLYVRTAFGPLFGLQVGWFHLLSIIGTVAACANLFVGYLANFVASAGHGWMRVIALSVVIAVPAISNYVGVRSGAGFCNLFTVVKLLPLTVLIVLGLIRFSSHFEMIHASEITGPGWGAWLSALLLLLFTYGGCEDTLAPLGEVKEPKRTVPFALSAGLVVIAAVYTLVQLVTVATIGSMVTDRPLVEATSVLIGRGGATFVAVAVMISTYGIIAAGVLNAPRLVYAFSAQGDLPKPLSRLHPRYQTPSRAILIYVVLTWLLALTGTFLWLAAVVAGAVAIIYGGICAALIRLRKLQPNAPGLRLPWARGIALIGIVICATLLTRLTIRELLIMGVTAGISIANWWWVKRRKPRLELASQEVIAARAE